MDNIRKTLCIARYTNEIEYIKNKPDNEERMEYLQNQLNEFENKKNALVSMKDNFNKNVYKHPWNKLHSLHKIEKVKEFYKDTIPTEKLNNIIQLINDKKLNSKKYVQYDENEERILSIELKHFQI